MPVHDWDQTRAGKFHHFHNSWIYKISDRLNAGLLPKGFYAAGEQVADDVEPDVLTLEQSREPPTDWHNAASVVAVEEEPPRVRYTIEAEVAIYGRKQDRVVIHAIDDDRIVALIEIVSWANKQSRHEIDRFLRKIAAALDKGYHLLVIDLHRAGPFDPGGIHAAIWEYLFGTGPVGPTDQQRTLVSYRAEPVLTAYVEPVSV
jgi:hypothetical protein